MIDVMTTSGGVLVPALVLDMVLGDPVYPLHPIRICGRLLETFERILRRLKLDGYGGGILLFLILTAVCLGFVVCIQQILSVVHPVAEYVWKLYIVWSLIALGDLCRHGKRLADAAEEGDVDGARKHAGMLVGRDLERMDGSDCCRAGIESLSENLTDGVISPLFYYLLFGIPGLILFKVVSTMDSMVGYKNEKYLQFGWCGARMDDMLNYVPARLTWVLMSVVASVVPDFDGAATLRTGWAKHGLFPGPNSGWSEAAAAGALGVKLIGPVWRDGVMVTDLWIGPDRGRTEARPEDLHKMIILAKLVTIFTIVASVLSLPFVPVMHEFFPLFF
jgi:adenosylcobinamide-phosphate synthase